MMQMFGELNIETHSACNRACVTCLRQSHPDQDPKRAKKHLMPESMVYSIIDQAAAMGFTGRVCLQHFNEPLMDRRLLSFAQYAKSKGVFSEVYCNSNGDILTPHLAAKLDGVFDRLHIALYDGDKDAREATYREWFEKTRLTFTRGEHVITHFSPFSNRQQAIEEVRDRPCRREVQMRCIINYAGEMLLCCDDINGNWSLGNVADIPLKELWFGDKHKEIVETLAVPGGRIYPYCKSCPRSDNPYWDKPTLTAVVVARDEEELLPTCLASIAGVWDELVVVVAAESKDRTRELAQKAGAKVATFGPWPVENGKEQRNYAELRNYAESLCSGDYIFWIDADEVLTAGHDLIKEIVARGEDVSVRPTMIWARDEYGNIVRTYGRQDLLHRKGSHVWMGKIHEWTEGPLGRVETGIIYEQKERPGGDRPHGDPFETLRENFDTGSNERHFFYLAREHAYAGHWAEAISLVDTLLANKVEWPMQRSSAAMLKGDGLTVLGRVEEAREAYIRGVREWGAWAEPYFAVGRLHYELQQWTEAVAWLSASCAFEKQDDGNFSDDDIYHWRRYDLLAVCLSKIGRNEEARKWGEKALAARPDDERLKKNMEYYQ